MPTTFLLMMTTLVSWLPFLIWKWALPALGVVAIYYIAKWFMEGEDFEIVLGELMISILAIFAGWLTLLVGAFCLFASILHWCSEHGDKTVFKRKAGPRTSKKISAVSEIYEDQIRTLRREVNSLEQAKLRLEHNVAELKADLDKEKAVTNALKGIARVTQATAPPTAEPEGRNVAFNL